MAPSKDAKKSKKGKKNPWDSSDEEAGGNSDDDDSDDDVKGKKMEDKSEEKDMNALFDAAKKITPPGWLLCVLTCVCGCDAHRSVYFYQ